MPFVGRCVEPVRIRRGVIGASDVSLGGEHEALANGCLVHVLRQIADLCLFADGLQRDLLDDSARVEARCARLRRRARVLADRVHRLNVFDSPLPECSLSEAAERGARRCVTAYRAAERRQECCLFTPDSRPPCVRSLYAGAAALARIPVASLPRSPCDASLQQRLGAPVTVACSAAAAATTTDPAACWQLSLEPVIARPWPVAVGLPLLKPRKILRNRRTGVLRQPRLSTAHQLEHEAIASLAGQPIAGALAAVHDQSRLLPSAVVAVNTSSDAFDRLAVNRAVSSGRAGRSLRQRRRLTLSGAPAELAGLRSHVETDLRLTTSTVCGVSSLLSRHLDLQPSVAVTSKNPDTYVTDESSSVASIDTRQQRLSQLQSQEQQQRRPSLLGRWLQRSRSLPRNFGRRLVSGESTDAAASGSRVTDAGPTGSRGILLDDRCQTVFVNFYGDPLLPSAAIKPDATVDSSAGSAKGGSIRAKHWPRPWPECSNEARQLWPAARRSKSQLELPRVDLPRSKPSRRRSASAERRPRCSERSTASAVGESFLSHTLPCLFRRKASSDEEEASVALRSSSTDAVVRGHEHAAVSRSASGGNRTLSAPSAIRSSRRCGASAQLLAGGVVLRKRDGTTVRAAVAASTSSGQWSSSDRYSFGSDGNSSAASSSQHRLCWSHASGDHDSAVCMDGGSRIDSRLGGSWELPESPSDATQIHPRRLPPREPRTTQFCVDGEKDVFDIEPLFLLQPDSEILSLYSVDQDGFYTTMHSDSLLIENVAGCIDDCDAYVRPRGKPQHKELCDGTAQTEVTFGEQNLTENSEIAAADASETSHSLMDADCHRSLSAASAAASASSSFCDGGLRCDDDSRSVGVQLFHSLVPVTPDASDDEREEGSSCKSPLKQRVGPATSAMPSSSAERAAEWGTTVVTSLQSPAAVTQMPALPPNCEPVTPETLVELFGNAGEAAGRRPDAPPVIVSAAARSADRTAAALLAEGSSPPLATLSSSPPSRFLPARTRPEPPARGRSRLSSTDSQSLASSSASAERSCLASVVSTSPSAVVLAAAAAASGVTVADGDLGQERPRSFNHRFVQPLPAPTAPEARTSRAIAVPAGDGDNDYDSASCCGSEVDTAADFPRMEADAEALNIATERCLSVLAMRFKMKDSTQAVSDEAISSTSGDHLCNRHDDSLVSSLIEQARRMSFYSCEASASLDDGLGRVTSPSVARVTPLVSRHSLSDRRRSSAGGISSCDLDSKGDERPNQDACRLPAGGSRSSDSIGSQKRDSFLSSPYLLSSSTTSDACWSPSDVAERVSEPMLDRSGSSNSRSSYVPMIEHPLSAFDAATSACRNVSYRIANAVQPVIDGSVVAAAVRSRGDDASSVSVSLRSKEAASAALKSTTPQPSALCESAERASPASSVTSSVRPIAPTLHQPSPPPRALSYRVANDGAQLCNSPALRDVDVNPPATSLSGYAAGSCLLRGSRGLSPSSAAAPGRSLSPGVREFMKGVYENSEQHLPALPLAPSAVDLVPIVTTAGSRQTTLDRSNSSSSQDTQSHACPSMLPRLPAPVRNTPSTFLPAHEPPSVTLSSAHSSAAGEPPVPGGWPDEEPHSPTSLRLDVLYDWGTTVPRRQKGEGQLPPRRQLQAERPRSTVLTKGDRHELEWMQNNFASILRRCFNDEDCREYASMEALRKDESSLLSLIDAVQEHTTHSSARAAAADKTSSTVATRAIAVSVETTAATPAGGALQTSKQRGTSRKTFASVPAVKNSCEGRLVPTTSTLASSCSTHTEV